MCCLPQLWTESGQVQLLLFWVQLTGQLHLMAHTEVKSWVS